MRTFTKWKRLTGITLLAAVTMAPLCQAVADDDNKLKGPIRHVLLISIDGMHALDLENCIKGVSGLTPYCPNLAALAQNGLRYTQALSAKPSDSFPGLLAMLTGGSPRSTGVFYDNSYDRTLVPPQGTCVTGKRNKPLKALLRKESNGAARGFPILVARLTTREHKGIFLLCRYFATQIFGNNSNPFTSERTNS